MLELVREGGVNSYVFIVFPQLFAVKVPGFTFTIFLFILFLMKKLKKLRNF